MNILKINLRNYDFVKIPNQYHRNYNLAYWIPIDDDMHIQNVDPYDARMVHDPLMAEDSREELHRKLLDKSVNIC